MVLYIYHICGISTFLDTQIFWDPMDHRLLIISFLLSLRLALLGGNSETTKLDLFYSPAQNIRICFLGYVSSLSCQRHLREIKCSLWMVLPHTSHIHTHTVLLKSPYSESQEEMEDWSTGRGEFYMHSCIHSSSRLNL